MSKKKQLYSGGPWYTSMPSETIDHIINYIEIKSSLNGLKDGVGVSATFKKNEPAVAQQINIPDDFGFLNVNVRNIKVAGNNMTIDINTTLNISNEGTPTQNLFYDYGLNNRGLPNLIIYIIYRETGTGSKENIIFDHFEINFENQESKIQFSEFDTIEIFIIDEDPRTSRGTVTTVSQPTTNN